MNGLGAYSSVVEVVGFDDAKAVELTRAAVEYLDDRRTTLRIGVELDELAENWEDVALALRRIGEAEEVSARFSVQDCMLRGVDLMLVMQASTNDTYIRVGFYGQYREQVLGRRLGGVEWGVRKMIRFPAERAGDTLLDYFNLLPASRYLELLGL